MKTFTYNDIMALSPCYNPDNKISSGWTGTCIDFLGIQSFPILDKIWLLCRQDFINITDLKPYLIWCAQQMNQTNQVAINSLVIANNLLSNYDDDLRLLTLQNINNEKQNLTGLELQKLKCVENTLSIKVFDACYNSSMLISYIGAQKQIDYLIILFNNSGL